MRFAIRVALACAIVVPGASASEGGLSASAEVLREYRQPVAKWPPFVVDEGVLAQELGELPPLAPEPWHTAASDALGTLLFFDPRLSASGQIACASCHDPELGWADGRRFPYGHDRTPGRRNSMTLLNVGYFDRWSWNGQSESLAQQVLRAIESPIEMNADLGAIVPQLNGIDDYPRAFVAAFGGEGATAEGIGKALATGFAHAGSDVVLVDLNGAVLEATAAEIGEIGHGVAAVVADVTAPDTPERIVAAAKNLSGRIDVLVNNAGIMGYSDIIGVTDEEWDRMYGINLKAPMRIMRAVLREMVGAGRGSGINIGSSWSSRASVFNQDGGGVDYCSAKAALQSLSRAAAQDVAPHGVRVNAIAPGAVDTPMHAHHRDYLFEYEKYIPLGRMEVAEDLVGPAIFLASDAGAYVTGQTIHVNGGLLMVD